MKHPSGYLRFFCLSVMKYVSKIQEMAKGLKLKLCTTSLLFCLSLGSNHLIQFSKTDLWYKKQIKVSFITCFWICQVLKNNPPHNTEEKIILSHSSQIWHLLNNSLFSMWSVCEFFLKIINYLLEFLVTEVLFSSSFCKAENHLIGEKKTNNNQPDIYPKQTQGILCLKI